MSVLKVKNGDQWDIVPAIKGDTGDPAEPGSITDEMLAPDGIKAQVSQLWGNQLTRELTGEILTAADAYAAPPVALTIDGKSTQASYTGLNLWDEEWEVGGYSATSGNVWNTTDRIRSKAENYIPVLPSTTYFNRCNAVNTCCFYDESKSFISSSNAIPNATFTTPANAAYMRFAVFPAYGTTYKHDICINVSGSMDGTYEPYVGGKPSPNPDYPQEIVSVEPRNILPSTVYHLAEDVRVVEGSAYRSMYCKVDPNTTYTVSRARALGNRFGVYTTTVEPAAGVALTTIKRPDTDTGILAYTFTTEADAAYAFFYLANNDVDVSDSDMQLEKGSVAHPYLPYGCSLALAFAGKNLFDPSHLLDASGWTVSDGVYTGFARNLREVYDESNPYPVGALSKELKAYTFSLDYSSADSTKTFYVTFMYADGSTSRYRNILGESGHYSFTTEDGKTLAGVSFIYSSAQVVSLSNIQLELGSTATAYEPYVGATVPIDLQNHVLRSLPDGTKDTLALTYLRPSTREGWAVYGAELVQAIKVMTLDGTQNGFISASGTYTRFGSSLADSIACTPMANKLANYPINDLLTHPYGINMGANNRLYFSLNETITKFDQTREWFTANPVTLQYALATPVTHDLGEVELPVLPAPTCTVWADPTTGLTMEYVQDTNIVIASLQAALADLATS